MKNINYLIALIFSISVSCKTTEHKPTDTELITLEGELYFEYIGLGSLYGAHDTTIQSFMLNIENIDLDESETNLFITDYYNTLNTNGLIKSPHFKIMVDSTRVIHVFTNEKQYRKIKNYSHWKLEKKNKKVLLKLKGELLGDYIYKCDEILDLNKVEGNTQWNK